MKTARQLLSALLVLALSATPAARSEELPDPGPRDLCPVCGMFVQKYPDWAASLRLEDESLRHFDGAKCLFRFLLDTPRFAPGHSREQVTDVQVTEYYDLEKTSGREALFMIGSDVLGPMGNELIPLRTREDAEEFLQDHLGERIVSFAEVDAQLIESLDGSSR